MVLDPSTPDLWNYRIPGNREMRALAVGPSTPALWNYRNAGNRGTRYHHPRPLELQNFWKSWHWVPPRPTSGITEFVEIEKCSRSPHPHPLELQNSWKQRNVVGLSPPTSGSAEFVEIEKCPLFYSYTTITLLLIRRTTSLFFGV